jgi:hypothetical protein
MSVGPYQLATACVQGLSHRKSDPPVPCQDACMGLTLSNGFPVAIVSDGAGSSSFSHLASDFCVRRLSEVCESNIPRFVPLGEIDASTEVNRGHIRHQWHQIAMDMFRETRSALLDFGAQNAHSASELHCTLILLIRTPFGFLSANIGDGRAGYHNGSSPAPLIVPFMTYTAGATYFLAKEGWEPIFRSSVVYDDSVDYFFATSDGCQSFVMDNSEKGPRKGIYNDVLGDEAFYDFNHPYDPFFRGLIESLRETAGREEADARLNRLIDSGIYVLNGEERELKSLSDPSLDDDKSIVIFYR